MDKITDKDRRIIAEWCGWKPEVGDFGKTVWVPPDRPGYALRQVPNYESLDSCAEFEMVVKNQQYWYEYMAALRKLLDPALHWPMSHTSTNYDHIKVLDVLYICWQYLQATPAQRCEAILTVIKAI